MAVFSSLNSAFSKKRIPNVFSVFFVLFGWYRNLPWGYMRSSTNFGPDRFSRFDVYWIRTDRQTKYIYIRFYRWLLCIEFVLFGKIISWRVYWRKLDPMILPVRGVPINMGTKRRVHNCIYSVLPIHYLITMHGPVLNVVWCVCDISARLLVKKKNCTVILLRYYHLKKTVCSQTINKLIFNSSRRKV